MIGSAINESQWSIRIALRLLARVETDGSPLFFEEGEIGIPPQPDLSRKAPADPPIVLRVGADFPPAKGREFSTPLQELRYSPEEEISEVVARQAVVKIKFARHGEGIDQMLFDVKEFPAKLQLVRSFHHGDILTNRPLAPIKVPFVVGVEREIAAHPDGHFRRSWSGNFDAGIREAKGRT